MVVLLNSENNHASDHAKHIQAGLPEGHDNWLQSHPQHRWKIDDIRQKERQRSRQQKISKRKRR